MKLLIATGNKGKVKEYERLLDSFTGELINLAGFMDLDAPEETGITFQENSLLKARYYATATGNFAFADDSGLEVEALGGAPGVLSARYAGFESTDQSNRLKLLNELRELPDSSRSARFACSLSFSDPTGNLLFEATEFCKGRIINEERGTGGFGYDSIFVPEGETKTFAELPPERKAELSHRAKAARKFNLFLCEKSPLFT